MHEETLRKAEETQTVQSTAEVQDAQLPSQGVQAPPFKKYPLAQRVQVVESVHERHPESELQLRQEVAEAKKNPSWQSVQTRADEQAEQ